MCVYACVRAYMRVYMCMLLNDASLNIITKVATRDTI